MKKPRPKSKRVEGRGSKPNSHPARSSKKSSKKKPAHKNQRAGSDPKAANGPQALNSLQVVRDPSIKGVAEETGEESPEKTRHESRTALQIYLSQIGEVELLTPKEEVGLAARIKKGSKKAREHMIRANLRLVVKIARDYEDLGLPILDLISEGNIGLMKGVERFDPEKGAKFATYGAWWIKQRIKHALAKQSKNIRIPIGALNTIKMIRRVARRLEELLGREPTSEELAEEVGLSAKRISELLVASSWPVSIDANFGDDDDRTLADVLADPDAKTSSEAFEGKAMEEMFRVLFKKLKPREAAILEYRFGFKDGVNKTLEEVGKKFGVTRERVRQIQNIAQGKLKKWIERLQRTDLP